MQTSSKQKILESGKLSATNIIEQDLDVKIDKNLKRSYKAQRTYQFSGFGTFVAALGFGTCLAVAAPVAAIGVFAGVLVAIATCSGIALGIAHKTKKEAKDYAKQKAEFRAKSESVKKSELEEYMAKKSVDQFVCDRHNLKPCESNPNKKKKEDQKTDWRNDFEYYF